jgi:hypothetical protein
MKKLLALAAALTFALPAFAAETLEGEATCGKCTLKIADKCQFAITVTQADGKKETILAENNDVAKGFHKNICQDTVKVKAEGTIAEKDGKKVLTLSKVEKVE